MLEFLLLACVTVAALAIGAVIAIPLLLAGALLWLVLLPLRWLFKIVFGVAGAVIGLLVGIISVVLGPILLLLLVVAVAGGLVAALLGLLAPLIPLVLLALLLWGAYRIAVPRAASRA